MAGFGMNVAAGAASGKPAGKELKLASSSLSFMFYLESHSANTQPKGRLRSKAG